MKITDFFQQMKELNGLLLVFFEEDKLDESTYTSIADIIMTQKIIENHSKFRMLLNLISVITTYHRIGIKFTEKFEKIFKILEPNINIFSRTEIFRIFYRNERVLYFFYKIGFLTNDDLKPIKGSRYLKARNRFTEFDKAEHTVGDNETPICSLIRQDLIDEFVPYLHQHNISPKHEIEKSFYEANPFLKDKTPTLIEYAAFYGSQKIFQYLKMNDAELTSSLWLYAVHSNNAQLIHLLEENRIKTYKYEDCINEAIKCHQNGIANYIDNNYVIERKSDNDLLFWSFKYYNFEYFLEDLSVSTMFLFAFEFDYFDIVKLIIKSKDFDPNEKIVFNFNNFFN